jgi:hypothetical protein
MRLLNPPDRIAPESIGRSKPDWWLSKYLGCVGHIPREVEAKKVIIGQPLRN